MVAEEKMPPESDDGDVMAKSAWVVSWMEVNLNIKKINKSNVKFSSVAKEKRKERKLRILMRHYFLLIF